MHPTLFPCLVDDCVFDGFDADRIGVYAQGAGFLAGRRTDPSGELRKIVGGVQGFYRSHPVFPIHEVVEIGYHIVDRTAAHAKRDSTVHAPRSLHFGIAIGQMGDKFAIVLFARFRFVCNLLLSLIFEETGDFAHD